MNGLGAEVLRIWKATGTMSALDLKPSFPLLRCLPLILGIFVLGAKAACTHNG